MQPVVSTLDASYGRLQGCSGQDANHGHSHLVPVAFGGNRTSGSLDVATTLSASATASATASGRMDFASETFLVQPVLAFNSNAQADQLKPDPHTSARLTCSQYSAVAFQSSQSGVRLGDTHGTLDANNGPRRHNGALAGGRVRRLTPRECERLQAFPDDYTLATVRGKPAADGPRYKALGNSMCVNVMRWIGWRVDAEFKRGTDAANDAAARLKVAA